MEYRGVGSSDEGIRSSDLLGLSDEGGIMPAGSEAWIRMSTAYLRPCSAYVRLEISPRETELAFSRSERDDGSALVAKGVLPSQIHADQCATLLLRLEQGFVDDGKVMCALVKVAVIHPVFCGKHGLRAVSFEGLSVQRGGRQLGLLT